MPLGWEVTEDLFYWRWSRNGAFSVKSMYEHLQEIRISSFRPIALWPHCFLGIDLVASAPDESQAFCVPVGDTNVAMSCKPCETRCTGAKGMFTVLAAGGRIPGPSLLSYALVFCTSPLTLRKETLRLFQSFPCNSIKN